MAMATQLESAGDGYARSDPARAIWCYEQARNLYEAQRKSSRQENLAAEKLTSVKT
jgi:hypothetical protein